MRMNLQTVKMLQVSKCLIGLAVMMLQSCDVADNLRDMLCGNWESVEGKPDVLIYKEGEAYKVTVFRRSGLRRKLSLAGGERQPVHEHRLPHRRVLQRGHGRADLLAGRRLCAGETAAGTPDRRITTTKIQSNMRTRITMIICLCLLFAGRASAQWVVSDPGNLAQGIINASKNIIHTSKTAQETVKIYQQGV